MKNGKGTKLRTKEYEVPEYGTFTLRELTVGEFNKASMIQDERERAMVMLSFMLLDDNGESIGREELDNYSMSAVGYLLDKTVELITLEGGTETAVANPSTKTLNSPSPSDLQ